jgi:hypothetical protein
MRRRLKVLSKGLLEASDIAHDPLFGFWVIFLHRTVKDYLKTPDAQSMLQSWSDYSLNVDWEICSALGTLIKIAPREIFDPTHAAAHRIWNIAGGFSNFASTVDQNPLFRADLASMLEHLQATLTPTFEEYNKVIYKQLSSAGDRGIAFLRGTSLELELVILSACVCFGVFNFVADKFAKEPQLCIRVANHVNSLLWCMLHINEELHEFSSKYLGIPMLELLLAHGADPNSVLNGETEWGLILEVLMMSEGADVDRRRFSFEGIKLLLRYGADFEHRCTPGTSQEGGIKANELLKEWFDADQFGVLEDIVKRRASKTKKSGTISKKMRHLKLWIASKK